MTKNCLLLGFCWLLPVFGRLFSGCFSKSVLLYGELVIMSDPADFHLRAPGTVTAFGRGEICSSSSVCACITGLWHSLAGLPSTPGFNAKMINFDNSWSETQINVDYPS